MACIKVTNEIYIAKLRFVSLYLTNLTFVHLVTLSSLLQEVVLEHHVLFFLLCWFFFLSLTS